MPSKRMFALILPVDGGSGSGDLRRESGGQGGTRSVFDNLL